VVSLNLHEILKTHKQSFRSGLIESLANQHNISPDEVIKQFGNSIDELINTKYSPLTLAVDTICAINKPVILNIMQDRQREDTCSICQANESNIRALSEIYGDSIQIFEISEDNPSGSLYHVLFQGAPEEDKKLPLTAVIYNGNIIRVWAGKAIDKAVYVSMIKKALR